MSRFVQLHLLTSYPPSNLNRDDTGRPKSAVIGNVSRLRVSSQSLKRAWRTSELFVDTLGADKDAVIGVRTKEMGIEVFNKLCAGGIDPKHAKKWAQAMAEVFGKLKKADTKTKKDEDGEAKTNALLDLEIEQLAHFSPEERRAIDMLIETLVERGTEPTSDELQLLSASREAVDIAMFGRMLAKHPAYNCEAAVQVAHAFTVHASANESDYFTAVDDLNRGDEDRGAAHIGEVGFGAGVYYLYVCIDRELLKHNLGGNEALVQKSLAALVQTMTKISPTGKQNTFASRAYASYVMAEIGDAQPRSLSQAFVKPVKNTDDVIGTAIQNLEHTRQAFISMYGEDGVQCAISQAVVADGRKQTVSLDALIDFIQQ